MGKKCFQERIVFRKKTKPQITVLYLCILLCFKLSAGNGEMRPELTRYL